MKLAIMQPYFLPYIGYFQLINAVDKFIIYDNIQYTKKGWINRNRILQNGKDEMISLSIKKDSDFLNINERSLSESRVTDFLKITRKIENNYRHAPYLNDVSPLLTTILNYRNNNLFEFIFNSITTICKYLDIKTEIIISSKIEIDTELKGQDKVLAICKTMQANEYINPIGGMELYSQSAFAEEQLQLRFLKTIPFEYKQFSHEFVPMLSILDVIMFNSKPMVCDYLQYYNLIT